MSGAALSCPLYIYPIRGKCVANTEQNNPIDQRRFLRKRNNEPDTIICFLTTCTTNCNCKCMIQVKLADESLNFYTPRCCRNLRSMCRGFCPRSATISSGLVKEDFLHISVRLEWKKNANFTDHSCNRSAFGEWWPFDTTVNTGPSSIFIC